MAGRIAVVDSICLAANAIGGAWVDVSAYDAQFQFADARTLFGWVRNHGSASTLFGTNTGARPLNYTLNWYGAYPNRGPALYSIWYDAGGGFRQLLTLDRFVNNQWVFVAETFSLSGANVVCRHFLNGAQVGEESNAGGWEGATGTGFRLFKTGWNSSYAAMAGFGICRRVLSTDELRALHERTLRPQDVANMVAYWPMTAGFGTTVVDVVNGYNGTFGGGDLHWGGLSPSVARVRL